MYGNRFYGGGTNAFYGTASGAGSISVLLDGSTDLVAQPSFTITFPSGSHPFSGETTLEATAALRLRVSAALSGDSGLAAAQPVYRVSLATALTADTTLAVTVTGTRLVAAADLSGDTDMAAIPSVRFAVDADLSGVTLVSVDGGLIGYRQAVEAALSGATEIEADPQANYPHLGRLFSVTDQTKTGADRDGYATGGTIV